MKITRVIHPIGQGAFYTETISDDKGKAFFNVVYDCGSETGKPKVIESYLDKYYQNSKPKRKIDLVFISHLHNDHINGLNKLFDLTDVKCLILPQLSNDVVLEALLYHVVSNGGNWIYLNDVILELYFSDGEYRGAKVIQISNEVGNEEVTIDPSSPALYDSGSIFQYGDWLYIPYNSPAFKKKKKNSNTSKYDTFYDYFKFKVNAGEDIDLKKIKDLFDLKRNECINAYKDYFGENNQNSYSMVLFSGTRFPVVMACCKKYCACRSFSDCRCRCYHACVSPNFLYTGDFEPNNKSGSVSNIDFVKDNLVKLHLWDKISGIQVPHHGSRLNFNSELYVYPYKAYVSVGTTNQHHHPNIDTLINIQCRSCKSIVVSEDLSSMQIETFDF